MILFSSIFEMSKQNYWWFPFSFPSPTSILGVTDQKKCKPWEPKICGLLPNCPEHPWPISLIFLSLSFWSKAMWCIKVITDWGHQSVWDFRIDSVLLQVVLCDLTHRYLNLSVSQFPPREVRSWDWKPPNSLTDLKNAFKRRLDKCNVF